MFWNKRVKKELVIHAKRSSVCMGDDCTAPNPEDLAYEQDQTISEFIPRIVKYVPNMKDSWWEVKANGQTLATVYFDGDSNATYKLNGPDVRLADIPDGEIFCRYNY